MRVRRYLRIIVSHHGYTTPNFVVGRDGSLDTGLRISAVTLAFGTIAPLTRWRHACAILVGARSRLWTKIWVGLPRGRS